MVIQEQPFNFNEDSEYLKDSTHKRHMLCLLSSLASWDRSVIWAGVERTSISQIITKSCRNIPKGKKKQL